MSRSMSPWPLRRPHRAGSRLASLLAASLLALALPGPAAGAAATAPLTLTVAAQPRRPAALTLVSRLPGGAAERGRSVAFFVVSREFKTPLRIPIGTVRTAADGSARLAYKPTWSGREEFVARLTGPTGGAAPTATAFYRVGASAPGPLLAGANPARPFAPTGHVFLDVIRTLIALVWLSLIAIVVLVGVRLPRLAHAVGKADEQSKRRAA